MGLGLALSSGAAPGGTSSSRAFPLTVHEDLDSCSDSYSPVFVCCSLSVEAAVFGVWEVIISPGYASSALMVMLP